MTWRPSLLVIWPPCLANQSAASSPTNLPLAMMAHALPAPNTTSRTRSNLFPWPQVSVWLLSQLLTNSRPLPLFANNINWLGVRAPRKVETHGWRISGMVFWNKVRMEHDVHTSRITIALPHHGGFGQKLPHVYSVHGPKLATSSLPDVEGPPSPAYRSVTAWPLFMLGPASNGSRSEAPHQVKRAGGMGGTMGCLYRHPGQGSRSSGRVFLTSWLTHGPC
ncbi:hypothetical protein QBC45DRAFT_187718 [Copromyces sp. CBS 386.78]|nr:hypothetical protein QBC45DRAFT_187718 [Copromyces sp. CBS 386.78]